jgi:hypothetical protein
MKRLSLGVVISAVDVCGNSFNADDCSTGTAGAFPHFEPSHVLMANLLGSIVTIWAVLRIRDPQLQFGRYDAIGRFLFAVWQIYAVIHGASVLILGFTLFEILFGVIQSLPVADDKELSLAIDAPCSGNLSS